MIKVKQFIFSDFGVNTYVVADQATRQCAIVDPAMSSPADCARLEKYIEDSGLTLTQIINTHLHLDHCFGISSSSRYILYGIVFSDMILSPASLS